MFVRSQHYNARKEETLKEEGQVISTKVKWDCKHCGWSSRDNASDMKKHLTKCQTTTSELKEAMKTEPVIVAVQDSQIRTFSNLIIRISLRAGHREG